MSGSGRRSHYRKHLTDAVLHDLPIPDESIGRRIALVVGTRGGNMFDVIVAPPSSRIERPASAGEGGEALRSFEDGGGGGGDEIPTMTTTTTTTTTTVENDGNEDGISTTTITKTEQCPHPIRIVVRTRAPQLAFLPTKFRKLIWIKRNDYVIVECGDEREEEEEDGGVEDGKEPTTGFRYVITNILYRDQVRHIKSMGLWPMDPLFANDDDTKMTTTPSSVMSACSTMDGDEKVRRKPDRRRVGGVATETDDVRPNDDDDDCDDSTSDRDGTYEEDGIVFDDPLGDALLASNTNRIAALRVMEDDSSSSSSEEGG